MSKMSRFVRACLIVVPLAGLQGCAMLDGSAGSASPQAPATTALGSGASPFVRAGLHPFSVANCMKFDALPQECERIVKGTQ